MEIKELEAALEGVLFAAGDPVPVERLCLGLEVDRPTLEAVAQPCFYSVTLRDRTRVRRDLWSRAEEDTLTGLFLRQMQDRLARAETDEDRALVEKAVRFGLAALENGEDCCP